MFSFWWNVFDKEINQSKNSNIFVDGLIDMTKIFRLHNLFLKSNF